MKERPLTDFENKVFLALSPTHARTVPVIAMLIYAHQIDVALAVKRLERLDMIHKKKKQARGDINQWLLGVIPS